MELVVNVCICTDMWAIEFKSEKYYELQYL